MIKKTLKKIGYVSAFLMFSTVTAYAQEVRHCRSINFQQINPVSAGVERVVLAVRVWGSGIDLPQIINKAKLEKIMKELYENRFSTFKGTLLPTLTPGCHDRKDQPVDIIDLKKPGGWDALEEVTKSEKTLSVLLHIGPYHKGYKDIDMHSDVVVFYISQMRPGVPELRKSKPMLPFFVTVSTEPQKIEQIIRDYIKSTIP